jgi:hypothetical protein
MANDLAVKNEVTTFAPLLNPGQSFAYLQQRFDHSAEYCAARC